MVLNAVGGNIESFLFSTVNRSGVGRYLERRVPPLLNAPSVVSLDGVAIGPPHFDENRPLRDQPPVINPESGTVAMDIQRVIDNTQWVFQFNDGSVYSPYLRKHPLGGRPGTPVIVQFARGDQTIPNPANSALVRNGDLADRATYFRNDLAYFSVNPPT